MPITEHRTYTLRCEVCDNGLAVGLGLVDDISDIDATMYDTVEELRTDAEQRHWYVDARIALCPRHAQTLRPANVEPRPCTAISETVGTYERQWHDVAEIVPPVGEIVVTRTRASRFARPLVRNGYPGGWFDPQRGEDVVAHVTHWRHQTEFERSGWPAQGSADEGHDDLPRMIVDGKDITDLLHPNGRCTCHGEGDCAWCHTECSTCGGFFNAEPFCECEYEGDDEGPYEELDWLPGYREDADVDAGDDDAADDGEALRPEQCRESCTYCSRESVVVVDFLPMCAAHHALHGPRGGS